MFSPSQFYALVSGKKSGPMAGLARLGLRVAEIPYGLAVWCRNRAYDSGRLRSHPCPVPVVSVGNLTLGGTGKTPMVEWIARWFRDRGVRVAVISRGYGGRAGQGNDEAMELLHRLPDVPHIQNPDRLAAARRAVVELGCQAIVLDDAFQHRRMARDLDLVLLDALQPFGFEHLFPRGTLREPISGLRRADCVVLSRAAAIEPSAREAIRRRVAGLAPGAAWVEVDHTPQTLRNSSGQCRPISSLTGRPVAAFCGIGNPAGFRHTLHECGYRVMGFREFADHWGYTRVDIDSLAAWAASLEVEAVVCTEKDLVKLKADHLGARPLWAVRVAVKFLAGQSEFVSRLERFVPA